MNHQVTVDGSADFCPLNSAKLASWGAQNPSSPDALDNPLGASQKPQFEYRGAQKGGSAGQLKAAREKLDRLRECAAQDLKQVWLDEPYWRRLARERQYRMPVYYLPTTKEGIEKVLRKLGQDKTFFREVFGLSTFSQLVDRNPRMPLWAFAGICLEHLEAQRRADLDIPVFTSIVT